MHDGWEKGVYTGDEAVVKIKELRQFVVITEQEIESINTMCMRQELLSLRSQRLEEASFEKKAELIARLGVKVMPTEDLKTRRICCRLNLDNAQKKGGENDLTKVTFGGRYCTIDGTFKLAFMLTE